MEHAYLEAASSLYLVIKNLWLTKYIKLKKNYSVSSSESSNTAAVFFRQDRGSSSMLVLFTLGWFSHKTSHTMHFPGNMCRCCDKRNIDGADGTLKNYSFIHYNSLPDFDKNVLKK